uniref:CYSTM domain-containing protein n=1 Tax=Macrostomum lignano TaxID=282301 RepID=A0A1I8G2J3_9PLAT
SAVMQPQAVHPVMSQPQPYAMYPSAPPAAPVVGQQPVPLQHPPQQRQWNSGLCSCFEDVGGCCLTYFCGPCELCCCVSERMGEQCCTPICLGCLGSSVTLIAYRVKLRARYNIQGSILDDCCTTVCCASCMQCQLKRELNYIENQLVMQPQTVHPVTSQPQAYPIAVVGQQPPQQRQWNSGVCGCFEDICGCCLTYWCGPCELCCCISERMGEQCCTPICLGCLGSSVTLIAYRVKLRARYNIQGSIISDCCTTVFCGSCVQCQIKRELDYIENQLGCKP